MFLLVPAHPGFPGQIPQSRKTVVCVCVTIKVASIVEPLGVSGSLPIIFFCVIYYVTLLRQTKMFCSVMFCSERTQMLLRYFFEMFQNHSKWFSSILLLQILSPIASSNLKASNS